ncbi:hypothetical protein PGTUg99_017686 [Puccinia graminis f. sp. tritici]|uniref:Uncharacterized protein n=1 Tax=Puccinia graminis f. sp. tritici TaxID=56615 RepID=A0A5B0M5N3_PUCGR|nr:hypothetical protein PGTUg99_017686 [Puccinia graminis f. sp. tritici]
MAKAVKKIDTRGKFHRRAAGSTSDVSPSLRSAQCDKWFTTPTKEGRDLAKLGQYLTASGGFLTTISVTNFIYNRAGTSSSKFHERQEFHTEPWKTTCPAMK